MVVLLLRSGARKPLETVRVDLMSPLSPGWNQGLMRNAWLKWISLAKYDDDKPISQRKPVRAAFRSE